MGMVRIRVSSDTLAIYLMLPEGTRIVDVRPVYQYNDFEFVLENDELPKVDSGEVIPLCKPIHRKETISFDWNLKEKKE